MGYTEGVKCEFGEQCIRIPPNPVLLWRRLFPPTGAAPLFFGGEVPSFAASLVAGLVGRVVSSTSGTSRSTFVGQAGYSSLWRGLLVASRG